MSFEIVPIISDHTQSDHTFKTNVGKCWEKGHIWYEDPNS